jgi:hypothetical protein
VKEKVKRKKEKGKSKKEEVKRKKEKGKRKDRSLTCDLASFGSRLLIFDF